jgi:hypothetical protein
VGSYGKADEGVLVAQNPALNYGVDIACVEDADELFSEVSGIPLVVQDMIHRITQKSFLGPNGDDRGIDVRKFCGAPQQDLTRAQPEIIEAITRDDRIQSADVTLTYTEGPDGTADASLRIDGVTALGPFSLVSQLSTLAAFDLENIGS